MPPPARPARPKGPGIVTQADLARHWKVSDKTARDICRTRGIRDTELRSRPTYRWKDVWRVEGAPDVAPGNWDAYREPLLDAADLAAICPELSARTIRRDLEAGRWPVIQLSDRVRRVRLPDVAEDLEARSGKRRR